MKRKFIAAKTDNKRIKEKNMNQENKQKKTIYRSVITVEILSERPVDDNFLTNLSAVKYEITLGDCSGQVKVQSMNEELVGHEAASAILSQGSSVDFFMMDENGNDTSDF